MKRKSQSSEPEEQSAVKCSRQEHNSPFSKPWKGSDAVLVVEDKELHIHTTVLSLASEYFQKMFNGNFKEAKTKRVSLKEKSYELIEHMLRLIYPFNTRLGKIQLFQSVYCDL